MNEQTQVDEVTSNEAEFEAAFEEAGAQFSGETADETVEPKETATAEDETATAAETTEAQTQPDPWEGVPDELRGEHMRATQRVNHLEHSFASEQQRAIGQQRRAEELEARIRELESGRASQEQTPADKPVDASLQELGETFPEVADALRALREDNQQLRAELDSRIQPVEQRTQQLTSVSQQALLESAHSDWLQVASSQQFAETMARAPKVVRTAFEENSQNIVDAENAAFVIDWYKGQNGSAAVPKPQDQAAQIKAQRDARTQAAVSPTVRDSVIPKVNDEDTGDDFEAGFLAADRAIQQGRM